jgi:transposase InsO family protein
VGPVFALRAVLSLEPAPVAAAGQALPLDHRSTRPYTPRTNGKAQCFIQTLRREWAYVIAYPSSAHRTAALARWLHYYNWHRPHSALTANRRSAESSLRTIC